MSRNKGTFNFAANFEPLVKAPLDGRVVVGAKADLINPATWQDAGSNVWLFKGIIVSVTSDPSIDNNGLYFLTDETNYTNFSYWIKIGGITPAPSILTFDGSIIGNDSIWEFPVVHNLNTIKQTITIWDASTNDQIFPGITRGASTNYISFFSPPSLGSIYNISIIGF
jgi:hypothetical protein